MAKKSAKSRAKSSNGSKSKIDFDKFRLRRFVEKLIEMDEVEIHDEPVALADMSEIIEATDKAVLFRDAGPDHAEIVSSVAGGRRRLAAAFGVKPEEIIDAYLDRVANPQPVIEVSSDEAPVHEVVMTGDDVDLSVLPFHPQHEYDGSTYMTSGIDFALDTETGLTNVGCRRLSLRSKNTLAFNLTAPSDLRRIYLASVARGEKLPVSFAIGSTPVDFMAAGSRIPADEVTLVGTLRGEPVPLVKCVTNDLRVPADTEMVLEGYFDEHGYREPEGPYGEYMGLYGPMHMDPVFHVTAVTQRKDVLHQTLLHGSGGILDHTDSGNMNGLRTEVACMKAARSVIKEPVAVRAMINSGGCQHIRVAIKQTGPGDPRKVINAILGAVGNVKHVFVVDEDVDLYNDEMVDWAMSTRFQGHRDLIVMPGMSGMPMDPSLDGERLTTKIGFDLCIPFGRRNSVDMRIPKAHKFTGKARYQTVRQALEAQPMYFADLMDAVGSKDGREVALAINDMREEGKLARLEDGQYTFVEGGEPELKRPAGDPVNITGLAPWNFRADAQGR